MLVALSDHPVPGVEQEGGEHVEDPGETLDQHRAGGDEHPAKDQRAEDPEEQHPVLVLPRDDEVAEDDRPDEHVVHRQRLLDEVAGEVLLARLGAVEAPDEGAERDAERHPDDRPQRRLTHPDDMGAPMGEEVDSEHGDDDSEHRGPHPERDIHDETFRSIRPKVSPSPVCGPARRTP